MVSVRIDNDKYQVGYLPELIEIFLTTTAPATRKIDVQSSIKVPFVSFVERRMAFPARGVGRLVVRSPLRRYNKNG